MNVQEIMGIGAVYYSQIFQDLVQKNIPPSTGVLIVNDVARRMMEFAIGTPPIIQTETGDNDAT
jgi:hypothetical protein